MSEDNEPQLTPLQRAHLDRYPEASLADSVKPDATNRTRELVGVHGWLYFFGISLVALGPLITVAGAAAEFANMQSLYPNAVGSYQWKVALAVSWCYTAIYCAISTFAGWCIFNRRVPITVPIVIACIWLMGPALAAVGLMVAQNLSRGGVTGADAGAALGRPLVYCAIWTIYLLRSKRVRNTYRSQSVKVSWDDRLKRPTRQFIFFSACWVVMSSSYLTFVSPPDPYASDAPNLWAIVLLPPLLAGVGIWVYRKFVGSIST